MRRHQQDEVVSPIWEMNPIWGALTDAQRIQATSQMEICRYRKNAIIHREGDTPSHMMMLVSGKIKIYKEGIGQRHQIIRLLKPCDFFSYRALVGGGAYNSYAEAIEPCVVYQLNKDCFIDLLQHNNQFCFLVMRSMAGDLGAQEMKTVNLTQKHIRGRLAESLLTLKANYGTDEDGATIAMYMSRDDLASMSNMITGNAIRTLSQFAQEGIISVDGRKIKILDEEELTKISRLG
jgi:CRP-like cAMP-binding protein